MINMRKIIFLASAIVLLCSFSFLQKKSVTTIFLIGDSTVANYADNYDKGKDYFKTRYPVTGWGQVFPELFKESEFKNFQHLFDADSVRIVNRARGGRSTRTFFQEGRWRGVFENLRKGDIVLMQFGHNDAAEKKTERYVNIEGFKEFLRLYVSQTRLKKAIPVILTPVCRNYPWKYNHLENVHGEYPQAAFEISQEMNVHFIDLNQLSMDAFSRKGREYVKHHYFMNLPPNKYEAYPDGQSDNTHFQPEGAKVVAQLVFDAMKKLDPSEAKPIFDFVVAEDGSGDFTKVQDVIDAIPHMRKKRTFVFIKKGTYQEKLMLPSTKSNISFVGEDVKNTILTYDDFATKKNKFGEEIGTSGSSSFYVYGSGFEATNITFENSSGPVGQAVAVRVDGDKVKFENCRFLGFQDTLYPHGRESRQYYKNCYIEGTVDFIFGWSTAVFEDCEIFCKTKGYITAASTEKDTEFGFVFLNCKITGDAAPDTYYLGRPWRDYAQTVFINCELGNHIKPEGWHNWNKTNAEKTAYYGEYKNLGKGFSPTQRVSWSHQLSTKEAEKYSLENIFKDWKVN